MTIVNSTPAESFSAIAPTDYARPPQSRSALRVGDLLDLVAAEEFDALRDVLSKLNVVQLAQLDARLFDALCSLPKDTWQRGVVEQLRHEVTAKINSARAWQTYRILRNGVIWL